MNDSSTYRLEFDPRAWRDIMALPEAIQNQIFEAVERLEKTPRPSGCKKLKRAGDFYRIPPATTASSTKFEIKPWL